MGGHGDDRRVTQYNPRTNTWRCMPSLQTGTRGHNVCTLDNKIFALGGWSGNNFTSGEMLDLGDNNPLWRFMADMNSDHYSGGAVVVGRKIYVLGGGATTTTNVEVYDVDQGILMKYLRILHMIFPDQWNTVTNMPTRRMYPGVAILDSKIYVTGGYDPFWTEDVSSVDCYDTDTNTWSQVADMNIARKGHSLVSLHGRLYAVGGWDVDKAEVYDPDSNTWTLLQHKLEGKVFGSGACLVKKYYLNN